MSTFSGLSTALSSLYAQRRGLDVTGNNIANANTDGYSRERPELRAMDDPRVPAMYSTGDPGPAGVTVTTVSRLHDEFLDSRSRSEHALNTYLGGQVSTYGGVEQVIGEPSDTGLQNQLAEFWGAWHDVANSPGDDSARTQLISRGNTVADTLKTTHDAMGDLWGSTRERLDTEVADVNQTASAIAELNQKVVIANQSGLPANQLADQRDQMVLHLSELTGATSTPRMDGGVNVQIAGSMLVAGGDARQLEVIGATSMAGQAADPSVVRWTDNQLSAGINSGQLASTLESLNTTITGAAQGLDGVAANLVMAVNTQHELGFDLTGTPGVAFFNGSTASDITVALTSPDQIAASGDVTKKLDNGNATALANMAKDPSGVDANYRNFVSGIGVASQTVQRRASVQGGITDDVDEARQATSGVNLDEEMTSLLQYQRAYEAAAKVVTSVDDTLGTLINMKQ